MSHLAPVPSGDKRKSSELSRIAALTVSQLILVQSLGKFTRSCIREACASLAKQPLYSATSGVNLDNILLNLSKNTSSFVRELERELMLWLMGKREHPSKQRTKDSWSLMDSEASEMEVLKARLENQLAEYVRFEISDFQQRWRKVQEDKFDPTSGVITPLNQGLFIVEYIRGKNFPEEISSELIARFEKGFPAECKKIHIELNEAFQAMGLKSGGWEVFNGSQRMSPAQI